MPGMTGVEVLRHAKRVRPEATRLLFTAYADIRAVIDAINQGSVFHYITKPWEPEELEAVVRQAVEQHDLIVENARLLAELKESNQRLVEANRLKAAFIEVASHELNTPVAVVLGMTELWKASLSDDAPAVQRGWVERVQFAAKRLAGTIERMFKLIRADEFGQTLDLKLTELEPLVRQVVGELQPFLEVRTQQVAPRPRPGPRQRRGRSRQARRHPDEPVRQRHQVHPRRRHDPGRRRPRRRRRGVRFEVADEGVGIQAGRPAAPVRAVLHRLRHHAPLLGRLPVLQAGDRPGPLPGQDVRRAPRRQGRVRQRPRAAARPSSSPSPAGPPRLEAVADGRSDSPGMQAAGHGVRDRDRRRSAGAASPRPSM